MTSILALMDPDDSILISAEKWLQKRVLLSQLKAGMVAPKKMGPTHGVEWTTPHPPEHPLFYQGRDSLYLDTSLTGHEGPQKITKDKTDAGCRLIMLFIYVPSCFFMGYISRFSLKRKFKLAINVSHLIALLCQVAIFPFTSWVKWIGFRILMGYILACLFGSCASIPKILYLAIPVSINIHL